jgi:hypothetical protein
MFICGNNEDAKRTVGKILDQFGWDPCRAAQRSIDVDARSGFKV